MTNLEDIPKTRMANINRAIRQLERGLKILNDNKCSLFCSESGLCIYASEEIPMTDSGLVDSEPAIEMIMPDCDYGSGAW